MYELIAYIANTAKLLSCKLCRRSTKHYFVWRLGHVKRPFWFLL